MTSDLFEFLDNRMTPPSIRPPSGREDRSFLVYAVDYQH